MRSIFLLLVIALVGCSSRSIKPNPDEVKMSREAPASNCRHIGPISGTTMTATATQDDALADLKKDAANKGANYVVIKEFSSYGTTVTGEAYECP